jgi:hypothetical protein
MGGNGWDSGKESNERVKKMTYTFKLARRLAVSRTFLMLPVVLLFAACAGDATAPENSTSPQDDWRPREATPVTVSVNPSKVTVETNQLIRFLAYGRNNAGDSVYAPITWRATGGTILPDGRFSAAAVGTFTITASTRTRVDERVDTSVVSVVRRQVNLSHIAITPDTVTLAPGLSHGFIATGYLNNGRPVPIGANWSATGGTIDVGGNYVAGDTAGTYLVIGTNTSMTLADTATITITAPAPPPPPAPAPPEQPPVPALAKVTLLPGSAILAPTATRRFTAYGTTTAGDSVSVSIAFAATGGTVTNDGLYTAGSTAGTYRVIATSGTLADTSSVTVTRPLASGPAATGIPFGPSGAWGEPNTDAFTLRIGAVTPATILARIAEARVARTTLLLAMTGGAHSNYLSVINGVLQFDRAKWNARMDLYNTSAIRTAIAQGVADRVILGAYVMDEPQASGGTNPEASATTWGPKGTLTKVRVDSLCRYARQMFPSLPVGVGHHAAAFEPTKNYSDCEFLIAQYATRQGSIETFRDVNLNYAQRDNVSIVFSLNILNGGTQDRDGTWDCVDQGGWKGQWSPLCQMTPQQIRDYARVLGPQGCALMLWRYNATMMADANYQKAFRDVALTLATAPASPCRRS